jgi:hypothetical protein
MDLEWNPAGAVVGAVLGPRYAVIAGSLGASAALRLGVPADGTFEAGLGAVTEGTVFESVRPGARIRTDVTPEQGYFPLDADTVTHCDAVWHVDRYPAGAAEVAARIMRLPGVEQQLAGPDNDAPEVAWDEQFFFAGTDRRRPFATIVGHDLPGFDDRCRLDRPGVFRLNIELGRTAFEEQFGYPPRQYPAHEHDEDPAAPDRIVAHPVYATHGWASVVNPGPASRERVDELLARAHGRHTR